MITTADKVINLIFLKYLKAKITYEHDRRVETYQFAREAIREAVYNAIAHNCYMFGTPIQIRIEDEEMIISNRSILPDGWTAETPDIANVFYRMGYIETWGRGVQKICDECRTLGAELPKYEVLGNSIRLYFKALQSALIDPPKAPKHQSPPIDGALESEIVRGLIEIIREEPNISQEDLGEKLGTTRRVVQKHINELKEFKSSRKRRQFAKQLAMHVFSRHNDVVTRDNKMTTNSRVKSWDGRKQFINELSAAQI